MSSFEHLDPGAQKLAEAYEVLVKHVFGNDYESNPNVKSTPERAAKAFEEFTQGYVIEANQKSDLIRTFPSKNHDLVIVRDIEYYSMCCHHLVPFYGFANIAYVPNESVLGLSKFARITEMFAKRLQIQENMTAEIADFIEKNLEPKGVAVVVTGKHLCMCSRGIKSPSSTTQTQAMRGIFKDDAALKNEFMSSLQLNRMLP